MVEEATMRFPVVVVAKRPRRALVSLREEAPIPTETVETFGKMKRESEEVANLSVLLPPAPVASVPQYTAPCVRALRSQLAAVRLVIARVVVVALVEVELMAVKFKRVEEPESKRFEREVKPPVAVKVPVKEATLEMV